MTDALCNYPDRDEQLVAYLYDDVDSAGRSAFGSHLAGCRYCQDDLSALRGVRLTLGAWAPPEPRVPSTEYRVPSTEPRAPSPEPRAWWHDVPAWAQVAAALFVLGVSATIANLDVHYDRAGLTIRTGWSKPPAAAAAPANAAPWRAELATFESRLRSEMNALRPAVTAASVPAAPVAMSDADFRRRVRILLDESEKNQQTEMALRLVQLQRDNNAQRQADLKNFYQNLGYVQRETYGELAKQREVGNYLLRVSQTK